MADLAVLAMLQQFLGGTAKEQPLLFNELARRLILNGMTISASGVITLGPFTFTPVAPWSILNGGTNSGTPLSGSSVMISNGSQIVQGPAGTTSTVLHGNAAGAPAYSGVVETDLSLSNVATANVTSVAHGLAPKAPNDTTEFLNGAATPSYTNPLNPVQTDMLFTDATNDIGKSGATRPRDIFASRDIVVGRNLTPGTVVADLLFTDASFDVGKSGATRPRDGFFSRNLAVGGTLGITGTTTLAGLIGGTTSVIVTDTGVKNDYAPGLVGHTVLYCNNATLLTIQGIAGGVEGQRLTIISIGAGQVDLAHQNTGSSAGNRLINFATSGNTSLAAGSGVADFKYDVTTARWRLVHHEQGAWITPTFSAGNYSGATSMTWTVASGDEVRRAYWLKGRTLTVANTVGVGSQVGGTPSTQLTALIPGGFSAVGVTYSPAWVNTNATKQIGYVSANVATPTKMLWALTNDGTNWTAGNTEVRSVVSFEVS